MADHTPTPEPVIEHPERIPGYTYGTAEAATSPLTLLAFTAVVIATSRDYLGAKGASAEQVDRMHAAFTKSVLLHVTVWTRPYVDAADW